MQQPLAQLLEGALQCDLVRGVVLTDATIGTFAAAGDRDLRQNRCFLYHVIGDSTGLWKVPVGGIGALTDQLAVAAGRAGADLRPAVEVTSIKTDETQAEVRWADGSRHRARHVMSTAPEQAKREAVQATLKPVDSVLAEPLEDCLLSGPDGAPCLEALTPLELESQLAMPGGHIFHRDLAWPFAQPEAEVGSWGTETEHANIWLCGAGARRGGGVSGIAGHNAARAVLEASIGHGAAAAVLPATGGSGGGGSGPAGEG